MQSTSSLVKIHNTQNVNVVKMGHDKHPLQKNLLCTADAKSTPSYSSNLHLSAIKNRSDRGQLICLKVCSKKLYNIEKM